MNALRSVAETSGLSASSALSLRQHLIDGGAVGEPDEAEDRLRDAEVRGRRGGQQEAAGQRVLGVRGRDRVDGAARRGTAARSSRLPTPGSAPSAVLTAIWSGRSVASVPVVAVAP